jgi:protein gp37
MAGNGCNERYRVIQDNTECVRQYPFVSRSRRCNMGFLAQPARVQHAGAGGDPRERALPGMRPLRRTEICSAFLFSVALDEALMSDHSDIEWTDATWNPVRGCTKVSPGCKHCYAETFAERFRGVPGHPYEQGFDLKLVESKLSDPLTWGRPRRVFVNSMSDLFQEGVPERFIVRAFEVMAMADWHTFQVLTKRATRMQQVLRRLPPRLQELPNVWLGVSVEDRGFGVPRIAELRRTPAAVRFLSVEPLLEHLGALALDDIDWVIVGGESGPGARPMEESWVLAIRDQCQRAGVSFFFKQWGGVQKKRRGRLLQGRTYDEYPASAAAVAPSLAERRERLRELSRRLDMPIVKAA